MERISGDSILYIFEYLQESKKTGCVCISVFLVSSVWWRLARRCLVRNLTCVEPLYKIRKSLVEGGTFNVSGAFKTKDCADELCLLMKHIVVYRLIVVTKSDILVQLADCLLRVDVLDFTMEDELSQVAANSLARVLRESRVRELSLDSPSPHWPSEASSDPSIILLSGIECNSCSNSSLRELHMTCTKSDDAICALFRLLPQTRICALSVDIQYQQDFRPALIKNIAEHINQTSLNTVVMRHRYVHYNMDVRMFASCICKMTLTRHIPSFHWTFEINEHTPCIVFYKGHRKESPPIDKNRIALPVLINMGRE